MLNTFKSSKLPPAIIDRRGYVFRKKCASINLQELIKNELIVKPKLNNQYKEAESFKVYTEDDENYYLPKFWALDNINIEPVIKYKKSKSSFDFKFKGILRTPQHEIIESMLNIFYDKEKCMLKPFASTIISIRTGGGKTVLGLFMMSWLKRKTIIFCHTSSLYKQWVERINDYIDGAKIGFIQGDKIKIKDCNIVIAMIQTVMTAKNNYQELLRDFDFVIYDECHHLGAKVFSSVMRQIQPPYSLGLSATVDRDDKLDCVFKWSLGNIGYLMTGSLDYDIAIRIYKFNIENCPKFKPLVNRFTKKVNISKMMVNLTEIEERNNLIVEIIRDLFLKSPTRHIVLISNFVNHLEILEKKLLDFFPNQVGLYIGKSLKKLNQIQKEEIESKQIILATTKIMEEGVDIKILDTIIIATPKKKIIQSCGRILRRLKHEYENIPLIVDIVDEINIFSGMSRKRMKQFKEKYLISNGSSLEYYKCNNDTEFKALYEYSANLKNLQKTNLEEKKITNIDYCKMFDSDSD